MVCTAVNGITATLATSENAPNSLFITAQSSPFDWTTPQNADLWKQTGGTNNVCPVGWHVPTTAEWNAEQLGTIQDAYNKLKITTGGLRNFNDGTFIATTLSGYYWTSSVFIGASNGPSSFHLSTTTGTTGFSAADIPANGESVRCIKD